MKTLVIILGILFSTMSLHWYDCKNCGQAIKRMALQVPVVAPRALPTTGMIWGKSVIKIIPVKIAD